MLSLRKLGKSFLYAFKGFKYAFKHEQNLQIHVAASSVVIFLGVYLQIRKWEMVTVLLLIMAILILELINTVFERLSDMLKPRLHSYVKVIKDLMAATVLIAALGAMVIGIIIFFPYLAKLFK